MKRLIQFMSVAALIAMQGCSFEEMKADQDVSHGETYKVSIHSDIFQQPATKVTTDGFCTGDEVGVYLVNYDGATPGALKVEDNQADNVRFTFNETGDWVSDYDIYYKDETHASYVYTKSYELKRSTFPRFANRDSGLTFVPTSLNDWGEGEKVEDEI